MVSAFFFFVIWIGEDVKFFSYTMPCTRILKGKFFPLMLRSGEKKEKFISLCYVQGKKRKILSISPTGELANYLFRFNVLPCCVAVGTASVLMRIILIEPFLLLFFVISIKFSFLREEICAETVLLLTLNCSAK